MEKSYATEKGGIWREEVGMKKTTDEKTTFVTIRNGDAGDI